MPFIRPADLASDAAPERAAWQHALRHIEADEVRGAVDVFVCIPTTAPLRVASDIDCCVEAFLQGDCDIAITVSPASNSPYYNMVELDQEHYARLVIPPQESLHARQKSPLVYDMNTVAYAASASHVLHADYIFNGRVKAVIIPEERSLDIDTDLDWQFAEFLIERNSRG